MYQNFTLITPGMVGQGGFPLASRICPRMLRGTASGKLYFAIHSQAKLLVFALIANERRLAHGLLQVQAQKSLRLKAAKEPL